MRENCKTFLRWIRSLHTSLVEHSWSSLATTAIVHNPLVPSFPSTSHSHLDIDHICPTLSLTILYFHCHSIKITHPLQTMPSPRLSPTKPLAARDIYTPSPTKTKDTTISCSDMPEKDIVDKPKTMEYHRQVLQSRLEEDK